MARKLGGGALLSGDPVGVAGDEPLQRVGHRRIGAGKLLRRVGHRRIGAGGSLRRVGRRRIGAGGLLRLVGRRRIGAGKLPRLVGRRRIGAGKLPRLVDHWRFGEARKTEDRVVAAGVHGHHRYFRLGHEVGPDPCLAARPHVPARGGAVTEGVDALLPVLELQLLFFLGEQARIDPWIVDELTALDDA